MTIDYTLPIPIEILDSFDRMGRLQGLKGQSLNLYLKGAQDMYNLRTQGYEMELRKERDEIIKRSKN